MDKPDAAITADDWEKLARDKLSAARRLHQTRHLTEAYEQAGYAVECALKARIMRHERLNQWPSRQRRRDLYTHDLALLLTMAGLEDRVLAAMADGSDIGVAWSIVKEWSVDVRYTRAMRPKLARDMVWAVSSSGAGLVSWIIGT